jgi:hypothetical protein
MLSIVTGSFWGGVGQDHAGGEIGLGEHGGALGLFDIGADLRGARALHASFLCADLTDSDLRFADFDGSYMRGAVLKGADMRLIRVVNADLRQAVIDEGCVTGYVSGRSGVNYAWHALAVDNGGPVILTLSNFRMTLDDWYDRGVDVWVSAGRTVEDYMFNIDRVTQLACWISGRAWNFRDIRSTPRMRG